MCEEGNVGVDRVSPHRGAGNANDAGRTCEYTGCGMRPRTPVSKKRFRKVICEKNPRNLPEQALEPRGELGSINAEITKQCTKSAFVVNE